MILIRQQGRVNAIVFFAVHERTGGYKQHSNTLSWKTIQLFIFSRALARENNFLVSLFKFASGLCGFYENKREAAHFGSRGCEGDERGARALFMSFSWSAEAPPRLLAARQPGNVKLSFVLFVGPTESYLIPFLIYQSKLNSKIMLLNFVKDK